jgi:hypothetical protein
LDEFVDGELAQDQARERPRQRGEDFGRRHRYHLNGLYGWDSEIAPARNLRSLSAKQVRLFKTGFPTKLERTRSSAPSIAPSSILFRAQRTRLRGVENAKHSKPCPGSRSARQGREKVVGQTFSMKIQCPSDCLTISRFSSPKFARAQD